ncbi:MAG: BamA/TamA family outer membrane protein [Luteitalea sp.]|nr:BamA/TamA family outer membrane protein [Luteitalea sp.]
MTLSPLTWSPLSSLAPGQRPRLEVWDRALADAVADTLLPRGSSDRAASHTLPRQGALPRPSTSSGSPVEGRVHSLAIRERLVPTELTGQHGCVARGGASRSRARVGGALACLVTAWLCAPAWAQEAPHVKRLSFVGTEHIDVDDLESVLATRQSSGLPWGRKRRFDPAQFQADLKRISAYYADRGYPRARVTHYTVVREGGRGDAVSIVVHIDEGQPVILEDVQFYGFDALSPQDLTRLKAAIPLRAGRPRRVSDVQTSRGRAIAFLRERGFAYATVDTLEAQGLGPSRIYVILAATLGPQARFGPITIEGNQTLRGRNVLEQLVLKEGEPYRWSKVQDSQRRLYQLELLQFASIDTGGPGEDQPVDVPVRIRVTEGKPRRLSLGLGYGSEERARATLNWRHVNFFGGARTAGIETKWSSLDRGVRLNFEEPSWGRYGLVLSTSVQTWYSDEEAYDLVTSGGRVTLTKELGWRDPVRQRQARTTVALSLVNEYEDYQISAEALEDPTFRDTLIALGLDPRTGEGGGTLRAIALDFQHNTTANLLNASSGYIAAVHLEQAGRWVSGDWDYFEMTAEGRYYRQLADLAVLAVRGRAGSFFGAEDIELDVPFFKRYFLGGSGSLRGWNRFQVAPLSATGFPLGGHSVFDSAVELRMPVVGNFSLVAFLDAGNVWPNSWDFRLNDLRYAAGPGLRYQTPIGPVRADVGYQLSPIEGLMVEGKPESRQWRLHFSIGQAF